MLDVCIVDNSSIYFKIGNISQGRWDKRSIRVRSLHPLDLLIDFRFIDRNRVGSCFLLELELIGLLALILFLFTLV